MRAFEKEFEVRWADVDPNMHLRQTAFIDYTDQTRVAFFDSKGFSFLNLRKLKIGPVVFNVSGSFLKEVNLSEHIFINCRLQELSTDYRKWKIAHDIKNAKRELVSKVVLEGAWLDLEKRKLTTPPIELVSVMKEMETSDFETS